MGEALRTLEKALLIHLVYPQTSAVLPIQPDYGKSPRLHVLDTGMLNYSVGIQKDILGTEDLSSIYHGTMIEHIVGQELLAKQYNPLHGINFWVREKSTASAEIDYLYQYDSKLIPIEVKSGSEGKLKSLHMFMDLVPHNMAIRFYAGNVSITEIKTPAEKKYYLLNLPYFLVSQIDGYLKWFEGEIEKRENGK
jgi:predicted AAA+ superfamily ATPase